MSERWQRSVRLVGWDGVAAEHQLELLEPRLMMSAAPTGSPAGLTLSYAISSAWFAQVSPSSYSATDSGSALMSYEAGIKSMTWSGRQVDVLADQWLVQLTADATALAGSAAGVSDLLGLGDLGGRVIQGLGLEGLVLLESNALDEDAFITALTHSDLIAALEPNMVISAQGAPDDPYYSTLWGLNNGSDADIDAPEAWSITTGSSNVVVAVIDTGVDWQHPDLAANIWTNPGEIAGNGRDDDDNGFVDDVHGYDFVNNDGNPMDDNGHGTHVSGTIGAVGDNDLGVVGVNWSSAIMALKFLGAGGSGFVSDALRAINYATMMRTQYDVNVRVMNNSWGGGGYYSPMLNAIRAAEDAGILFVVAAGNESNNNDASPSYPAGYNVDNVISVAASTSQDRLASFSNYGATQVDLAAPGASIRSTLPGGQYGYYSGTSMATPHVAGVAALLWAADPSLSYQQVKNAILGGVDSNDSLSGKVASGGRLNAYNSLQLIDTAPSTDPYENNDSTAEVDAAAEGAVKSPNLGLLTNSKTINGLNTNDDGEDWFKFRMNGDGNGSNFVRITFDDSGGNLDLRVYRSDGTTLVGSSTSNGDSEQVSLDGEDAGTYYVKVNAPGDAQNSYQLTINPGMSISDDYEDNDTQQIVDDRPEGGVNSPNLGLLTGQVTIDHLNTLDDAEDWFRFRLSTRTDARYFARINFTHSQGDLDLAVYRANGSLVGSSYSTTNREQVSLDGEDPGVYYVRVYGYRGAANPNYTLTLGTPGERPDGAGNDRQSARNVSRLRKPRTFTDYVGVGDNADYYRVNLNGSQRLVLRLKGGIENTGLTLLDENGDVLSRGVQTADARQRLRSRLAAGTYYVVVDADDSTAADYRLRMLTRRAGRSGGRALDAGGAGGRTQGAGGAGGRARGAEGVNADLQALAASLPTASPVSPSAAVRLTHLVGDVLHRDTTTDTAGTTARRYRADHISDRVLGRV